MFDIYFSEMNNFTELVKKKDFELGVGVEGQDTSRNFEGSCSEKQ